MATTEKKDYDVIRLYGEVNGEMLGIVDRTVFDTARLMCDRDCEIELIVMINSCGGKTDVSFAIHSLLTQYPGPVTTFAMGPVHSAAALIFLAGKKRLAAETASFMFHYGKCALEAPHNELQAQVNALYARSDSMRKVLASATGISESTAHRWLRNGISLTAGQAVKKKIAHRIETGSILAGKNMLI